MATLTNAGGTLDGIEGTTASHDKNGVIGSNNDTTARNAATPEGNGVFGTTSVPDGAGVFGLHESGGVGVAGFGLRDGIGVVGISAPEGAKGGDGVFGLSNSEHRNGIVGRNDSITARASADPGGNGVLGFTQVPDGAGVFGVHASTGIGVAGLGLIGISGGSVNGVGVMGVSAPVGAKGGDGVQGITNSEFRNGVYGLNESTTARGNTDPAGNGVLGFTNVSDGAGILGVNGRGGFGVHGKGGHGVHGTGQFGVSGTGTQVGVWGIGQGSGYAGQFSGPILVQGASTLGGAVTINGPSTLNGSVTITGTSTLNGSVTVSGDLEVKGDISLPDRDIAERFEIERGSVCPPGTVMVIGESGALTPCSRRYDKRAIGVVSGAGTLRTAITLGASSEPTPNVSIALIGTAYCCVDADLTPLEVGDLVTTSDTIGHGMKAVDHTDSLGAIIGKALAPLNKGRGLVPIVLALQ